MASCVNFGAQQYFGFDPRTIPGCALWLDAADSSTLTLSGSSVTAWNDKSGNGRNATGGVSPTRGTNGVVFNGTSQYLATTYSAVPTAETFFGVATWTGTVDRNYCIIGTSAWDGRNFNVQQVNGGGVRIVKWDRWGVAGYAPTTGVQPNVQFLASGIFTGSSGRTAFNGGSLSTSENFSFAGSGTTNIGAGVLHDYFAGTINELVVYSTVLTDADRQEVEGYLAWKWGLQSKPPATHPFKLTPPIMRAFLPPDVLAPTFWLDAADATTFTLSGSTITQWRDKSSNQYAGTPSGSPVHGTLNGRPAVAFNGSRYFDFGDVADLGSANLNMFVVCQFTTTGNGSVIAKSLYGDAQLRYSLLRESGSLLVLLQGDGGGAAPGVADTSTAPRLVSWTWDRTTQTLYQNGTSILSSAFANTATFNSSYKLLIGGYNDGTGGTPPISGLAFNGTIGEVLFLFGTLTTAQRQQVEGYLAQKWGLGSSLPTTHPYRSVVPSTPLFAPVSVPGLALWLDAADSSTLTLSGTNITQWADKSGNSNTAVAGTTTYPVYTQNGLNGAPIVRLQGANDYFLVANNFTTTTYPSITYFIVINPAASQPHGSHSGILSTDTPGAFGRTLALGAGSWQQEYYAGFTNITPYTANVWTLVSLGFVGTSSATLHLNGVAYAATASGTGTNTTGFKIGSYNDTGGYGTYNTTFDCAEILVYGASLTTVQRQQIEGYLAQKWGLQARLPATHPFTKVRP